uniref:Neuropeptide 39 n=1 Tax=Holothuria leucospilota TaxID=206669 RepID=A0A5B8XCW8_HOLLE|nr:neuropeptide 39 [Holothuria leucospilota]
MNSKVVCFLLILSVVIAVTASAYEEDDMEEMLFEQLMEKRAARGKGRGRKGRKLIYETCPKNPRCVCLLNTETGEYTNSGVCGQANAANVGI